MEWIELEKNPITEPCDILAIGSDSSIVRWFHAEVYEPDEEYGETEPVVIYRDCLNQEYPPPSKYMLVPPAPTAEHKQADESNL